MMRHRALQAIVVALSAVIVVVTVWALFAGRPTTSAAIPVVLVNLDEPVTIGDAESETLIAAGRTLAAELTRGDDDSIDWTIVGPDALDVVETDAIIVTIPEDFSATVAGVLESAPGQGIITVDADPSASLVAARVAASVAEASVAAFNDDIAALYIENVFVSYEAIADGVGQTAEGAASLADGAGALADGTTEFTTELDALADGAESSASGTVDYTDAVADLAAGMTSTADGASSLAAGLEQLDGAGAPALTAATGGVVSSAAALAAQLTTLASSCDAGGGSAGYCASVSAAASQAAALAASAAVADATADEVVVGISSSATAAESLADSSAAVARGARALAVGGADLADASLQLSQGARGLAAAARSIADGQVELAESATQLQDAIVDVEGAIPAVSESERAPLAESLATPSSVLGARSPLASDAIGAVAAALALWISALVVFARRHAVPAWATAADARPLRATILGFAPAVLLSAIAAVAVWGSLLLFGVLDSPLSTLGVLLLGAVAVAAIAQSIVAVAGRQAPWVLVILAIIQLAAAGLVLPIETAPDAVQELGALLPLSVLITGLRDASAGVAIGLPPVFTLVVWTGVAIAATAIATRLGARRNLAG